MISRLRYVFREMWASMSRNKTLTAATVITSNLSPLRRASPLLVPIQRSPSNPGARQVTSSTGRPSSPRNDVSDMPRNSTFPIAATSIGVGHDFSATVHLDEGATGDVQAGLDHALVTEADTDSGLGTQQAALADGDLFGAAARERAHDAGTAADVRAVSDDDPG